MKLKTDEKIASDFLQEHSSNFEKVRCISYLVKQTVKNCINSIIKEHNEQESVQII